MPTLNERNEMTAALIELVFMARTSPSTRSDPALIRACERAERVVGRVPPCARRRPEDLPPPPRSDEEALQSVPKLRDQKAVVLYFPTQADLDEFVAAIRAARPEFRTVQL